MTKKHPTCLKCQDTGLDKQLDVSKIFDDLLNGGTPCPRCPLGQYIKSKREADKKQGATP